MYHMGYHLEAQRQQRTIDRKKEALEKIATNQKGNAVEKRQQTASGNRLDTCSTRHQSQTQQTQSGTRPPHTAPVAGQYQRLGQPVLEQRVFSRPDEYQNRWLNKRFHIRHDPNLVALPLRKVDVIHQ